MSSLQLECGKNRKDDAIMRNISNYLTEECCWNLIVFSSDSEKTSKIKMVLGEPSKEANGYFIYDHLCEMEGDNYSALVELANDFNFQKYACLENQRFNDFSEIGILTSDGIDKIESYDFDEDELYYENVEKFYDEINDFIQTGDVLLIIDQYSEV